MFTITPIGSCRITTPLRRGQTVHGFNLNMERCYGYCHSPAEAVQMARFMQGTADIPQDVWPLVSRKHALNTLSATDHRNSDLYVVELASAKQVTIGGISIQLNYLNATFTEFFSDTNRAQSFWALAESGDTAQMRTFLEQNWAATPQQHAEALVLGRMRLQFVTRESLQRDIKTLSTILPDVLFVSHIDACKEDGSTIGSRSRFIQMVSEEVSLAGCKFYNPTNLMAEFGQSDAIEDESTGLAHFTDAFGSGIMDQWMDNFIAPKTDAAIRTTDAQVSPHLSAQISATCENGRFAQAAARLQALTTKGANVDTLLDGVLQAQNQAGLVFLTKIAGLEVSALSDDEREVLVLEASEIGLLQDALKVAQASVAGLSALPVRLLLRVGTLAVQVGRPDIAFEFYLAATRKDNARACDMLAKLSIAHKLDVLAKLETHQRASFLSGVSPKVRVQLLHLNDAPLTEAVSPDTTPDDVEKAVSFICDTDGIGYAAEVLAAWRAHQDTDRVTYPALISVLDSWTATTLQFHARIDRIHGLNAVLFAAPRHQPSRLAMQDLRKELALVIRAAGKSGDIDALDALATEAAALSKELPELDLWRARLRFAQGEYEIALQLGTSAATHLPKKINIWVLLMRAAKKADYTPEAVEFARKVIGLACPKTEALKAEAEAILQSHLVGA